MIFSAGEHAAEDRHLRRTRHRCVDHRERLHLARSSAHRRVAQSRRLRSGSRRSARLRGPMSRSSARTPRRSRGSHPPGCRSRRSPGRSAASPRVASRASCCWSAFGHEHDDLDRILGDASRRRATVVLALGEGTHARRARGEVQLGEPGALLARGRRQRRRRAHARRLDRWAALHSCGRRRRAPVASTTANAATRVVIRRSNIRVPPLAHGYARSSARTPEYNVVRFCQPRRAQGAVLSELCPGTPRVGRARSRGCRRRSRGSAAAARRAP